MNELDFEKIYSSHFLLKHVCPSFLETKNECYSHFEEKGGHVLTTEEFVIASDCVLIGISSIVLILMGGPNSLVICTLYPEPRASTNSTTTASITDQ